MRQIEGAPSWEANVGKGLASDRVEGRVVSRCDGVKKALSMAKSLEGRWERLMKSMECRRVPGWQKNDYRETEAGAIMSYGRPGARPGNDVVMIA